MKKLIILFNLSLLIACSSNKENTLQLVNDEDVERKDAQIVIHRDTLVKWFGEIPDGKVPFLKTNEGKDVPSQIDDMDEDSIWDEMALVYDFKPNQKVRLNLLYVKPEEKPVYKYRTNVRFAKKLRTGGYQEIINASRLEGMDTKYTSKFFQMEGPAWESDKVGFRNYFDRRNSMDIFGKTTEEMVLDSAGIGENYHEIQNWGMDILKVGNSLGAGAVALMINDSIYRICLTCNATYKLVTEGPVRSVFRLHYDDFDVAGRTYDMIHEISIWAGSYAYDSKITLNNARGDENLILGIVNKQSDSLIITEHNEQFVSILTHDKQAFDGEYLGMSILMNKEDFNQTGKTLDSGSNITETYYAKVRLKDKPVKYSFYAGWEKSNPGFNELHKFAEHIQDESDRKKNPIEIRKY